MSQSHTLVRDLRAERDQLILCIFFFLIFLATSWHMEFPGQGLYPSCSCNLHCSCSNAGSLTHCAGPGIKPEPQHWRNATDPLHYNNNYRPVDFNVRRIQKVHWFGFRFNTASNLKKKKIPLVEFWWSIRKDPQLSKKAIKISSPFPITYVSLDFLQRSQSGQHIITTGGLQKQLSESRCLFWRDISKI